MSGGAGSWGAASASQTSAPCTPLGFAGRVGVESSELALSAAPAGGVRVSPLPDSTRAGGRIVGVGLGGPRAGVGAVAGGIRAAGAGIRPAGVVVRRGRTGGRGEWAEILCAWACERVKWAGVRADGVFVPAARVLE